MISHPIHRVESFKIERPFTLRVRFEDDTEQIINFRPVLAGEIYGALCDLNVFNKVRIDPEVHTLIWPNGADFDPATLHDWPQHAEVLAAGARQWEVEKWNQELSCWRGAQGAIWGYRPSLSVLTIQLKFYGRSEPGLHILCAPCNWIRGPVRWKAGTMVVEALSGGLFVVRDRDAQLEVGCEAIRLKPEE